MLGNLHVRYCEGENPQGSTYLYHNFAEAQAVILILTLGALVC